ncbi:helix-turn-helix transcriptional regulator [Kribbella sp. NPDC049227]|uniref:helix-turn-helix transcriptional regulator n=1 Tax=Kribbella sp. NPDC049227 TaxID=3364113 RepID=UPI003718C78F
MGDKQAEAFGPWLGRQLRRAGMTQADLAVQLDLTRAAVSAWITGRAEPREETKRAIAEALGTDPASIYNRTEDVVMGLPRHWRHRPAHLDGGREYGNAAAFAFDADLSVLAREATQNSLDECHDLSQPVSVRYTLHSLSGESLSSFLAALNWQDLLRHYESAAATDQKVSRSLRVALDELSESGTLVLLRIDDYNAAGLTGPEYGDGRFAAVVRRQLDSHKQPGARAGGSYGLGKATLWGTSRFGLVMINSTLSLPHEGRTHRRVIGRVDLPWHEIGGEAFAGPGWFGEPDTEPGHENVSRSWWADEQTVRDLRLERPYDAPGTSFLIVGAHDASGDAETLQEMHDKLVRALADGFWAAMVSGRAAHPMLEARVMTLRNGQVFIPEERVDPHAHHPVLSRALQAYLDGNTVAELRSSDQVAQIEVPLVVPSLRNVIKAGEEPTKHSAVLLLTPTAEGAEGVNRVVCMRGTRMTVNELRPRDLPLGAISFQAVLLAGFATGRTDPDVAVAERFLRASEPPDHDRWDRTEELTSSYERGALSRLREFRSEIDRAVRQLVGRREVESHGGPAVLRELLRLSGASAGGRRAQSVATVHNVSAHVEDTGGWQVRVDLRLPVADDPWLLTPVAKFDVRSGGRPMVAWKSLAASQNCTVENENLVIAAGVRAATFVGITDPSTHPVQGGLARLVIEVQKTRGGLG